MMRKKEEYQMNNEKSSLIGKTVKAGRLQKLRHLESNMVRKEYAAVSENEILDGQYLSEPVVGHTFQMFGVTDGQLFFKSSTVKSLCVIDSEDQDKLVLPSDFPEKLSVQFPKEIQAGDILFATLNSVYWLQPDRKGAIDGSKKTEAVESEASKPEDTEV
jgi:hypothetical protein